MPATTATAGNGQDILATDILTGVVPLTGLAVAYFTKFAEDKHHWRDMIASSTFAYGVALLTVTPEIATYLAPVIGPNFFGLR